MKRLVGALAVSALLVLTPALAFAGGVTDLCEGQPSCVVEDGGDFSDFGDFGSDPTGIPGWFVAIFLLVLVLGVCTTVYRVSTAREMARKAGLDADAAGRIALLEDNGLSAAYVASSLRQGPEAAAREPSGRPAAERLAELQALKDAGTITESEYAARRQAVLDSI